VGRRIANIKRDILYITTWVAKIERLLGFGNFLTVKKGINALKDSNPEIETLVENRNNIFQNIFGESGDLSNVKVDTFTGMLFDQEYRYIIESSSWTKEEIFKQKIPIPRFMYNYEYLYSDKPLYCMGYNGYYHWLIEELPLALTLQKKLPQLNLIVSKYGMPKQIKAFLHQIGFHLIDAPRFLKVQKIHFICRGSKTGSPTINELEIIREVTTSAMLDFQSNNEKIYITRRHSSRSPKFEAELVRYLAAKGFKIIALEHFSIPEQIAMFAGAKTIVAIHGAGLSGIVWSNRETNIIELIQDDRIVDCFKIMSSELNLNFKRCIYSTSDLRFPRVLKDLLSHD